MLGQRIRERRRELGLSQQQLAGEEMSRVFISLVEAGKSNPSPENLRLIALRLGKPVEFFLDSDIPQDSLEGLIRRLQQAEGAKPDGSELASLAERFCSLERRDLEARARLLLARSHWAAGTVQAALEEFERTVVCLLSLHDAKSLAETYLEMGHLYGRSLQFARARRCYEQAGLYASGLKTMGLFRVDALTCLGKTLVHLGQFKAAGSIFYEALHECTPGEDPLRHAKAALGIGWSLYHQNDLQAAQTWTRKGLDILQKARQPTVEAKYNLAVIESARGNLETAYGMLRECLESYKTHGQIIEQAAVLEEMARYWQAKGQLDKAEAACWQALDLLDIIENSVQRGRVYRALGLIAEENNEWKQAYSYLRISHNLLRRAQAEHEAALSEAELERFRSRQEIGS